MIYFVRHGETVWNRMGRLQGRADSPLTRRGVEHAMAYGRALAEALAGAGPVRLHSSPLGRARQTAALIADALGLAGDPVRVEPLLAEHDVGEWTGLSWAEIEQAYGATPDRLRDWHFRPPGGETRAEMLERAAGWMATRASEGIQVLVSHGGMSRAFRAAFLGLDAEAAAGLPGHTHGRLYRLLDAEIVEIVTDPGPAPAEALLG
jgi:probable phosphoglycerate mutase